MIFRFHFLLLIMLTIVVFSSTAFASVDNSRFQEANAAYNHNDFRQAIAIYEELLYENGYSAPLLYNLGNSYAQAGKTGKAILNYKRALRLAPNDSDIIGNLQLVRTARGLFTRDATFSERFLHLLSMNQWVGAGGLALVLFTATFVFSFWRPVSAITLSLIGSCCLATIIVAGINSRALYKDWTASVVTSNSSLLISPFEGAAAAGSIQEGRIVYPENQHGNYLYVAEETGRKGWIEEAAVESVIDNKQQ